MFNKRYVFAAACMGMLLFGIVFLSLGSVNNMLAERFHLDDNSIGTLTALLPFGILTGSIVFGPVVDRFGYKWLLILAALIVMGSLEGMAFATTAGAIQACVFAVGFGGGILNGATNALAADVSEGERGAKLSLLGVFFGIGALGMPSVLATLSRHYSLTSIVAGIGAFALVPPLFFLCVRFPPPKQSAEKFSVARCLGLLRHPIFLFAGLALAIQSGMEGMSNDWMTRYLKKVTLAGEHSAEWKMLLGLVAITGAMTATRLALSRLLKTIPSPLVLFSSMAVAATGTLLLMYSAHSGLVRTLAPTNGHYLLALLAALLIGAGLAAAFPVVLSYIGDRFPDQSGTAFSTIFFLALVGNMTINKTFGKLAQHHGMQQYPAMMLGCLLCSAILLVLVVRQFRKSEPSIETLKTNEQSRQPMAQ